MENDLHFFEEVVSLFRLQAKKATSEDERLGAEQDATRLKLELRQLEPEYQLKLRELLSGCPFTNVDVVHFQIALQEPVAEVGALGVYAKSSYWRVPANVGRGQLKPTAARSLRAERRGNYWLAKIEGSRDLKTAWADFKFEFLAFDHDYIFDRHGAPDSVVPVGPVFRPSGLSEFFFQACRITHGTSLLEIRIHSCVAHNRRVEFEWPPPGKQTNEDLRFLSRALRFLGHRLVTQTKTIAIPDGMPLELARRLFPLGPTSDIEFEVRREVEPKGRRKGRRNQETRTFKSKREFDDMCRKAVREITAEGEAATRKDTAHKLGLANGKALDRWRRHYADDPVHLQRWRSYLKEVTEESDS